MRTWTLVPFSHQTARIMKFSYANETVYLAQANSSQFMTGGTGMGTFDLNGTVTEDAGTITNQDSAQIAATSSVGSLLRFDNLTFLIQDQV